MRSAIQIVGLIAIVIGLFWIGQGMGWINWPPSSFMIDQRKWALIGAALVVVGLIVLVRGRRRR